MFIGFLKKAATNVVYSFTVIALVLVLLIVDRVSVLFNLSLGKKDNESISKSVGNSSRILCNYCYKCYVFGVEKTVEAIKAILTI